MSFMRTLASVAVGFAAAKGMEKYSQMGGMSGLQKMMEGGAEGGANPMAGMMDSLTGGAGNPMADMMKSMTGGAGNPMAGMMDSMTGGAGNPMADMMKGMTGGADNPMGDMLGKLMGGGQGNAAAGMAGLGGLMAAFQGAAKSAGAGADDMTQAFFSGTPASVAMEENAKMMIRAMVQAAKADGEIDDEERAKILAQLEDVSAEERAFVEAELAAPLDPMRLATQAGDAVKAQIYATSLMAIKVDTRAEVSYLDQLAEVLGLSDQTRSQIHAAMGIG